jgi:hypothetical protein
LAGRKAIFLLVLILMASPVAGLRPIRAGRARTCRTLRPVRRSFMHGPSPQHCGSEQPAAVENPEISTCACCRCAC